MEMQELMQEKVEEEGRERPETEACLTGEEVEEAVYSQLEVPTEDIYSRPADQPSARTRPDAHIPGNGRVYRGVCFLLSVICVVLLLVIILLCVKFPAERLVCPEKDAPAAVKQDQSQCSFQSCRALYPPRPGHECVSIPACTHGWQLFEDSCYFLSRERLSWEESRQDCRNKGGDLAVITNDRAQNFLTQRGNLIYWIGLKFTAGKWTWVDNNALGKSYWTGGSGRGDCGTLVGKEPFERSWLASPCNYNSFYICQSPTHSIVPAVPTAQG